MILEGGVRVKLKRRVFNLFLVYTSMILLMINLIGLADVSASGPLPTVDEPTAYCHYSGVTWMNGLREDSESEENINETEFRTADETWTWGFPLREGGDSDTTLSEPIYFDTSKPAQGWFQVTFEVGFATNPPSDVIFRLVTMENESPVIIGEDSVPEYVENAGSYKFEMNLTKNVVDYLSFQVTWTAHPGTTTIVIDTNGGSFVTLPLVLDTDGDGVTDNDDAFISDPAASVDSDGEGYPDEWNEGYDEEDSTTGLKLDAYPNDSTRWEKEDKENGTVTTESIIMVVLFGIVIVVIIIVIIIARRKK